MRALVSGLVRRVVRALRRPALLFLPAACLLAQGCGGLPTHTDDPSFRRRYGDFTYCTVEVVRQSRDDTCGPACLSSVLQYWDVELPEARVLQKYPTPKPRPYLLVELRAIAEAEGLKAYVIAMDDETHEEICEQISKGRPLVCAVRPPHGLHLLDGIPILGPAWQALAMALNPRKNHFVVVAGHDSRRILLMDPAHGFVTLSWPRFETAWSRMKYACLLVSK